MKKLVIVIVEGIMLLILFYLGLLGYQHAEVKYIAFPAILVFCMLFVEAGVGQALLKKEYELTLGGAVLGAILAVAVSYGVGYIISHIVQFFF